MIDTLEKRQTLGQLLRYGLAGGAITLLGAVTYWLFVAPLGMSPRMAVTLSFLLCLACGFGVHSGYSFRDHGDRDNMRQRMMMFVAVNLVAFAMNWLWVFALVEHWAQPDWAPMIPMIFVTPLASFVMHRRWTFG
ncbi:GtrA family protein [Sphingobium boeckii]|uniref:Putative flippase GtrA n=1 Tax=Sphingobium boeckii TaxID=1082345 RepID=A0A7W9ECP9_9SPHN|nr:GtrA family protein [Sphingobium boeckii]MBB5684124.1 putative flippase GtrA [Sphingobium boeckii]